MDASVAQAGALARHLSPTDHLTRAATCPRRSLPTPMRAVRPHRREVVMRPAPAAAALTRRTLLAGLAGGGLAALLAACTGATSPTVAPNGLPVPASPPAPPTVPTATGLVDTATPPAGQTRAAATASRATSTAAATPAGTAPQLIIAPTSALLDDPVAIRLAGLAPGQAVELRARTELGGRLRDAVATFRADAAGSVNPATQAPEGGTYAGVDPTGLFWSGGDPYATNGPGTPAAPLTAIRAFGVAPTPVTVTASVAGRAVGTATVTRAYLAPGVARRPVGDDGLYGTLFTPAGPGPFPGVITWGGGGGPTGGLQTEDLAGLLASHGFVTLALAYSGAGALPREIGDIPLEYVGTALDFLAAQPGVRGDRLGVVGASKGAELALLAGTLFPRIGAVVAYAPTAVLWPGTAGAARVSAWTYRGQPFPYVPVAPDAATQAAIDADLRAGRPYELLPVFLSSLRDEAAVAAATIPVERIAGPVLTIAGGDDRALPAALSARRIADRLAGAGHPYPDAALIYPDAGHFIGLPNLPTTGDRIQLGTGAAQLFGGTAAANAAASTDSWPRVIRFLAAALA